MVLHILAWLPGQCIATHRPLEPSPLRTAGEDTPGGGGDGGDTGCGGDAAPVMRIDESMAWNLQIIAGDNLITTVSAAIVSDRDLF